MPRKKINEVIPDLDSNSGNNNSINLIKEIGNCENVIKDYKFVSEKISKLYYELHDAEEKNQYPKILRVLRKLLILDHGNMDLVESYSDTLKKAGYADLAKTFMENISENEKGKNIIDNIDSNMNDYKKIENYISGQKLDAAQILVYEKLQDYPFDQYFVYLQSKIYYLKKDLLKAKIVLEDILTTNPDFNLARNDLAVIYHESGLTVKAIECLRYALESNNYNYDILKNLGDLYCYSEKYEEALSVYKLIVNEYPEDTEVLKTLSRLSLDAGFKDDAVLYLTNALKIDPRNKELEKMIKDISDLRSSESDNNVHAGMSNVLKSNEKNIPMVSIIILTFNNLYYTRETLKSIAKYTDVPYELIVVDNGSTDGTKEYLINNPRVTLISNLENRGFAAGCNQGMSIASGKYILLLNNDVIVTENWLSRMVYHIESQDDIGIVGPMTNYISGGQLDLKFHELNLSAENVINDGDYIIQKYAEKFYSENKNGQLVFSRITGFCMLINRRLVDAIGGFDENFGIGNYEDDDYCIRAKIAGFRSLVALDVFIYHFGSRSFAILGNQNYKDLISENHDKITAKYSCDPEIIYLEPDYKFNHVNIFENIRKEQNAVTIDSKSTIALCMIVKDEAKNIERCLNSVVDFVNEIIIVDTGSTDETLEIAKKFKANIIHHVWNNDFSVPRNIAIQNSKSDWILFLDADEELSPGSINLFLSSAGSSLCDAYTLKIINILEEDSFNKYDILPLTRFFKNRKGYRYKGIIHEQIRESILMNGGVIENSEICIIHHGYRELDANKIERNSALLKIAVDLEPGNPYYMYQLGITLFSKEDNKEAIEYLLRAYKLSLEKPNFLNADIIEKLLIKISQFYLQRDELDLAEKYNNVLIKQKTENPVAIYIRAAILFSKKKYSESLNILLKLKQSLSVRNDLGIDMHQIYIDLGNNYYILEDYNEAFLAFQSALEINKNSYVACFNLGNLLFKIGHLEDAVTMFEWALRLNPELDRASEMVKKIKLILSEKDVNQ